MISERSYTSFKVFLGVILALLILVGGMYRKIKILSNLPAQRDTTTIVKADTITIEKPIPQIVRIRDTIRITEVFRDTITNTIILPREEKVYQEKNYRAVVSGFRPNLDTIQVFNNTIIREVTETKLQAKYRPYGIGLIGGVGYTGEIRPFIGIGVYFHLVSLKK